MEGSSAVCALVEPAFEYSYDGDTTAVLGEGEEEEEEERMVCTPPQSTRTGMSDGKEERSAGGSNGGGGARAICGIGCCGERAGGAIACSSTGILSVSAGFGMNFYDAGSLQAVVLPHPPSDRLGATTCVAFAPSASEPRARLVRAGLTASTVAIGYANGAVRCWDVTSATAGGGGGIAGSGGAATSGRRKKSISSAVEDAHAERAAAETNSAAHHHHHHPSTSSSSAFGVGSRRNAGKDAAFAGGHYHNDGGGTHNSNSNNNNNNTNSSNSYGSVKGLAWFVTCERESDHDDGGGGGGGNTPAATGDSLRLKLLAAHAGGHLVAYDTSSSGGSAAKHSERNTTGAAVSEIWRHHFGEEINQVSVNELDRRQVCVVTEAGSLVILLIRNAAADDFESTQYRVGKSGDGKRLRIRFASTLRDLLFVLLPRELLSFDTRYGKPLVSTIIPRKMRNLVDIVDERGGDLLYCTHACGSLSLWQRKPRTQVYSCVWAEEIAVTSPNGSTPSLVGIVPVPDGAMERKNDIVGDCGRGERRFFISVTSDCVVSKWQVQEPTPITVRAESRQSDKMSSSSIQPPQLMARTDMMMASASSVFAVHPSSMSTGHQQNGTRKGSSSGLVAVGTARGNVQIIFLPTSSVVGSYQVHSEAVKDVAWLGHDRVCSLSSVEVTRSSKESGAQFKNTVVITNLVNGNMMTMREKTEAMAVENIKCAPSGALLLLRSKDIIEFWVTPENATPSLRRSLEVKTSVVEWFLPHFTDAHDAYSDRLALVLSDGALGVIHYNASTGKLRDGRPARPEELGPDNNPWGYNAVSLCARGSVVIIGDVIGNIRIWNIDDGACSLLYVGPQTTHWNMPVRSLHLSPVQTTDGSIVAALIGQRDLGVFSLKRSSQIWPRTTLSKSEHIGFPIAAISWVLMRDHDCADQSPTTSERARLLVQADEDCSLHVFDIEDHVASRFRSPGRSPETPLSSPGRVMSAMAASPKLHSLSLVAEPFAIVFRMMVLLGAPMDILCSDLSELDGGADVAVRDPIASSTSLPMGTMDDMIGRWISQEVMPWRESFLDAHRRCRQSMKERNVKPYESFFRDYATSLRVTRKNDKETSDDDAGEDIRVRLKLMAALCGSPWESKFWDDLPEQIQNTHTLLLDLQKEESENDAADLLEPRSIQSPTLIHASSPTSDASSSSNTSRGMRSTADDIHVWDPSQIASSCQSWLEWRSQSSHLTQDENGDWIENLVMDHVSLADTSSAVSILLSTPSHDESFYRNILRATALAAASSPLLHSRALRVAADRMYDSNDFLGAVQLLYVAGDFEQACKILESKGRWDDAATMASNKLGTKQKAAFMKRYGVNAWSVEGDLWKAAVALFSAGDVLSCIRIFCSSGMPDIAVGICEMCEAYGLALGNDVHNEVRREFVSFLDALLRGVL